YRVVLAPHQAADGLSNGADEPVELHQRASHLEPAPLVGRVDRLVVEDALADHVEELVELVEDVEVAVDDDVEEAVDEVGHTAASQVGGPLAAILDRLHGEPVIVADGDEPALADEGVDLGLVD